MFRANSETWTETTSERFNQFVECYERGTIEVETFERYLAIPKGTIKVMQSKEGAKLRETIERITDKTGPNSVLVFTKNNRGYYLIQMRTITGERLIGAELLETSESITRNAAKGKADNFRTVRARARIRRDSI